VRDKVSPLCILYRIGGTRSVGYEETYLLEYNDLKSFESSTTFQRNMSSQFQGSNISEARNQHGARSCCLLIFILCLLSTLKMGAEFPSETLVDSHRTALNNIPGEILG
jgi:hypothetical protein